MSIERIFDIPRFQLSNYPSDDALASKVNGKWITYTSAEVVEIIDQLSHGLLAIGAQPDDKIAIISNNRPEWNFLDMAMSQIGVINVPLYPNITVEDYRFIFNDAKIKWAFISDQEIYDRIKPLREEIDSLIEIYSFNEIADVKHWKEVLEQGKGGNASQIESLSGAIKPNDLATLIYTSGTTGNPKGVMLSHNNIMSNVRAAMPLLPVDAHKALSFLPLNHSFERMITYLYMCQGVSIYYAESMETIGDNLKEVHPHIFTTVPRLLEKVYDKIMAKGFELSGIKKKLFFWALALGLKYELLGANGPWYAFQLKIANKIIFNKWREALGGEVQTIVTGGAALQPRLARVFTAAQINVLEGYGLTETSPVIAVNRVEEEGRMFGTVGLVLEGVDVKIAADGEIICKGPNVMLGYYNRSEGAENPIDQEGWFHTGDIGELVDGKYLKITDRKKELFKTSGGKYVAPQPIENKFKESPLIEQIMVVGENRKFVSALIVPSVLELKEWCTDNSIEGDKIEELIKHEKVLIEYDKIVESLNSSFDHTEQIKKFALLATEWSIDSGELTPTLKLKRRKIFEKYESEIEMIYSA